MSDDLSEHEAAIQDRISEHYRHAALRLAKSIEKNGDLPSSFSIVQVLGSPNTRTSFLKRIVSPLLSPVVPLTFAQSLNELCTVAEKFEKLGIYSDVSIDVSEAANPNASTNDIDATIHLKERSRLWARTGTDFGNQEGSAYASANLRNVFGGAESVEANMSFGTRTKASYEVKFSTPVLANPDTVFEVLGYGQTRSNPWSSHDEISQGGAAKLKHLGRFGVHEFTLGGVDRRIGVHENASLAIRKCLGVTRKISLLHHFIRDQRDDALLPSSGYRIRSTQEIAGGIFGGDTSFVKVELDGSTHFSIADRTTLNVSLKGGIMTDASLSDKFQLGGPQSVRGFMFNGLGPRSGKDSLGGTTYYATGISLLTPVPRAPLDWPVRFHAFVNAGHVGPSWGKPSVSSGVGLVFRHPIARVEVSFTLPMVARTSDRTRKGLSFGLGVDFI